MHRLYIDSDDITVECLGVATYRQPYDSILFVPTDGRRGCRTNRDDDRVGSEKANTVTTIAWNPIDIPFWRCRKCSTVYETPGKCCNRKTQKIVVVIFQ